MGTQRCHTKGTVNVVITDVGQVNFMLHVRTVKRLEFILGCIQAKRGNYSNAGGVFASGEISVQVSYVQTALDENTNATVLMQARSPLLILESWRKCLSALQHF